MNKLVRLPLAVLLALGGQTLMAAPYTPASDAEVLQHLPAPLDAGARAQRAALARNPQQLPLALALARAAIERGRISGDARELGQAQAALAPWWTQAEPPAAVRLLRAIVRQSQHDFAAALSDLDVLVRDPATRIETRSAGSRVLLPVQAQAGLTRASVLQVTGRLDDARAACTDLASERFQPLGDAVRTSALACLAELDSLQGRPTQAATALAHLARPAPQAAGSQAAARTAAAAAPWLALMRAELAERLGDDGAAQAGFRAALADGVSVYTLAAQADWLIDRGRFADALRGLDQGDTQADALLLRRAIALRGLGDPSSLAAAARIAALLDERFAAARLRGENFHQREQARLALDVRDQPRQALALAQDNWKHQKEPADALLLLRAAVAAGDTSAAEPVRRLQTAGWFDVRLLRTEQAERLAALTLH